VSTRAVICGPLLYFSAVITTIIVAISD
jgi:hypothetical protein